MSFDSKMSSYTDDQVNEMKSRLHLLQHFTNRGWKFRDMPQDNDIDAEIEVFETLRPENGRQTSAKFIKAQLKSIKASKVENGMIVYACPVKFLRFCAECEIPVILFLYDVQQDAAYWIWAQYYIYHVLENANLDWKNNVSSVTVRIPISNMVSNLDDFYKKLIEIAYQGISEIALMKKFKQIEEYYKILEESDDSLGNQRRVSAKILVEKSLTHSRDAMKIIVKKVTERLKQSDYYRYDLASKDFQRKSSDVVSVCYYSDLDQVEYGYPFCRSRWINPSLTMSPIPFTSDRVDDIGMIFDGEQIPTSFILKNQKTKGEYLHTVDRLYDSYETLRVTIESELDAYNIGRISIQAFQIMFMEQIKPKLDHLYDEMSSRGLPPSQCKKLDQMLRNSINLLHNIGWIVGESSSNGKIEEYMIRKYLKDSSDEASKYPSERKRIR